MGNRNKMRPDSVIESLFLLGGGRIARGLERVKLARDARLRATWAAALSPALTWLPLLVLAAVEGLAWGDRVAVPLLKDFLPYGQFLLAVPVLVLGEVTVGKRLGWVVAELRRSDVLAPEDTPALDGLLARAVELWRGRGLNTVLVLLTCAYTGVSLWIAREWLTGGWQSVGDRITLAGWWYLLISVPVMRFLTLRWLWRLLLWAWVLWRVSRLSLQLRPAHPDRAGGLAFLGTTQAEFGVLVFALSVQLSCLIADAVCFQGADLMAFRGHVIAFVLIVLIVLLLPLLVFAPKLVLAREESLLFLSGSAYNGADHLERLLRSGKSGELPADEISGLSDFAVLFENASRMRPVPLELRNIFALVLAAALPFLPLIFLVMPVSEVFRTLTKLLM
jgi:hypothetical protein